MMKTLLPGRFSIFLLFIMGGMVMTSGCVTGVQEHPPELPPAGALYTNLSLFQQDTLQTNGEEHSNFRRAVEQAETLSARLHDHLALPAQIISKAHDFNPTQNRVDVWIWSYPVTVDGLQYATRLQGEKSDSTVRWQAFVQTDFIGVNRLLFEGGSTNRSEKGTIDYFGPDPARDDTLLSQIEWIYDSVQQMKITLRIHVDSGDRPSRIVFEADSTSFQLQNITDGDQLKIDIRWDPRTGAGSITEGGGRYCWNNRLENRICSAP